jgi:hypothetical protein
VDDTPQVDIHNATPMLKGQVTRVACNSGAGVIEHVVQPAVLRYYTAYKAAHALLLGHIYLYRAGSTAGFTYPGSNSPSAFIVDIGNDYYRVATSQFTR